MYEMWILYHRINVNIRFVSPNVTISAVSVETLAQTVMLTADLS